jgi:hypothetical protein
MGFNRSGNKILPIILNWPYRLILTGLICKTYESIQNTYVFSDVVTNLKNTPRCHCVYIRTGTGGMAHALLKYMSSLSLVNFLYLLTANIFF